MNIEIDDNKEVSQEFVEEKNNSVFKKVLIVLFLIMLSIFLLVVYARYKATSGLKVYEYKIANENLPDSFYGIKVVHFSDLHFGNTVDIKTLEKIVKEINKINPDIVIFTGDLVHSVEGNEKNEIIKLLNDINYTIGKYAIKGEDDVNSLFDEIILNSGFTNLTDSYSYIYHNSDFPILISNVNMVYDGYSIALMHEPDKITEYSGFDLALAGHSHNGQINVPFIKDFLLPNGANNYYEHYYMVNGTDFYISSGIGTNNFMFRLFNKPSINLYRLT